MSIFQKSNRIFCSAAFAVLGAFGGVGVVDVVLEILGKQMAREHRNAFLAGSIPKLIIGAVLGFGLGLAFALFLFKARTDADQEAVERKYRLDSVFSGVPVFLLMMLGTLFVPRWDQLERKFGMTTVPCLLFGTGAVIFVLSTNVRPRIPRRLIVPLGLLGWMLAFIIGWLVMK